MDIPDRPAATIPCCELPYTSRREGGFSRQVSTDSRERRGRCTANRIRIARRGDHLPAWREIDRDRLLVGQWRPPRDRRHRQVARRLVAHGRREEADLQRRAHVCEL